MAKAYEFRVKAGTHSVGSVRYKTNDVFVTEDNLLETENAGHEKFALVRELEIVKEDAAVEAESEDKSSKASDLVKGGKGKSNATKADESV